ncbi:MAG: G5 domain-containing protein [Oscillospiraceae bacterium]|nr:G5 domain-containing protein [Oscillospiraceae bacterium]
MLVLNPAVHNRMKLIVRFFALLLPMLLLLPLLSQTADAKTTYVITDGDQIVVHTTSETDPHHVLEEAGLTLSADDTFTTAPGTDETEITVRRCQTVTLNYCGQVKEISSYGETVEALLNRLGLTAYGTHVASVSMNTMTYDGMTLTVDDILQEEQTYTQEVPFEINYLEDPSLPAGQQKIAVAGVPGQVRVTANVTYKNSVEATRTVISETILRQSVDQVVMVGTGGNAPNTPIISDGVIITADGEILTYKRSQRFVTTAYSHLDPGCDMTTATGTTVRVGTVAIDPSVVAYGTRMFIVSEDGEYVYGIGTAEDCGVTGRHLDLYFPTREQCVQYGGRFATVYFLN